MTDLVLNLKAEFFDAIKSGEKTEEYRAVKPYWSARLLDQNGQPRTFKRVVIRKGYPRAGDPDRELIRPWRGLRKTVVFLPFSANIPMHVYAIKVN